MNQSCNALIWDFRVLIHGYKSTLRPIISLWMNDFLCTKSTKVPLSISTCHAWIIMLFHVKWTSVTNWRTAPDSFFCKMVFNLCFWSWPCPLRWLFFLRTGTTLLPGCCWGSICRFCRYLLTKPTWYRHPRPRFDCQGFELVPKTINSISLRGGGWSLGLRC